MLTFSSNWRKKFGYDPIREQISRKNPKSLNIHKGDIPAFVKIMRDTAAGVPYSEAEIRIRDIWGNFTWSRIRATVQYDLHRQPVKAVGAIDSNTVFSDTVGQQRIQYTFQMLYDSIDVKTAVGHLLEIVGRPMT